MRIAHLKIHHRFDRLRLRGLSGARDEFHLAAIVQNLKTLALRVSIESDARTGAAQNPSQLYTCHIKPIAEPRDLSADFFDGIGSNFAWLLGRE